jgi:hypothetical protein
MKLSKTILEFNTFKNHERLQAAMARRTITDRKGRFQLGATKKLFCCATRLAKMT